MLKKDLKNMSFEDLVALKKVVNNTIIDKRKNDVGDLIRELKILYKKRNVLNKRIDDLQRIIIDDKLFDILSKNHEAYCFFNSDFNLLVYNKNQKESEVVIDIEVMQILKSKGYSEDEINSILNTINDVINGEAVEIDATDILLKKPYEYQLELFEALESDILMSDEELDEIVEKFDLDGVDLQRFVTEFKYNENGAKNEE